MRGWTQAEHGAICGLQAVSEGEDFTEMCVTKGYLFMGKLLYYGLFYFQGIIYIFTCEREIKGWI